MPARAAPVCAMLGKPFLMSAAMFTIEPPCFSIDWVKTSRLTMKPPVRLLRTTTSKPLALMLTAGEGNWPPALLNRPWMRPFFATIAAIASLTCASSRMSKACVSQLPPEASISAFTVASLSGLRPVIATCAPSAAISCAVQRPMPLPPPVTMMVWPSNSPGLKTERYDMFPHLNGRSSACI